MKKVSIIVPVYGVEKYIEKCARSVFSQTYSNLDIIFVDDCTPDKSISILKRVLDDFPQMKDRSRILSYEKNRGLAGARKYGLEHAVGDYVLQIDSDDYIASNMVEAMLSSAESSNADIVICDFNYIENGKSTHVRVNPPLIPRECMIQILKGEIHGSVANKLIRRSLYFENGIWPTQGLDMCEDLSVTYRLFYYAKKISYLSVPFYNYLIFREDSYNSSSYNFSKQDSLQKLSVQITEFCSNLKITDKEILEAVQYWQTNTLGILLKHGNLSLLNNSFFGHFTLSTLIRMKLPISSKILLYFYKFHLFFFIRIIRCLH